MFEAEEGRSFIKNLHPTGGKRQIPVHSQLIASRTHVIFSAAVTLLNDFLLIGYFFYSIKFAQGICVFAKLSLFVASSCRALLFDFRISLYIFVITFKVHIHCMDADKLSESNIWSKELTVNLSNVDQSTCKLLDFELSSWQAELVKAFFGAEGSCITSLAI
jgi:hypothetical protein